MPHDEVILLEEYVSKELSPKEAIILRDLLFNEFDTRERLCDQIWGLYKNGGTLNSLKNLRYHIANLRKKLIPTLTIDAVPRGYKLNGYIP